MKTFFLCLACIVSSLVAPLGAQQPKIRPPAIPPGFARPASQQPKQPPPVRRRKPQPVKPTTEPATPASQSGKQSAASAGGSEKAQKPSEAGATQVNAAGAAGQQQPSPPPAPAVRPTPPTGALNLENAALTEVIDALCRQLKINYILDPRVEGGVILNTYGETKNIDTRSLLDLILRINGATMVKVGDIYRIVPLTEASRLPIRPQVNPASIPEDDQIMLNLVFLKYVTVEELAKLLEPFIGEGGQTWAYPPANLLLLLDSHRNMRRTMELVSLFDSDTLASQRVRVFETKHRRPSELSDELETVLKSISLNPDASPIKFLPIDRLNLILAIAPNPGAFEKVDEWLKKLDQPVKVTAGTVDNYVYRVKYRRAEALAGAIMQLYGGYGGYGMGMGMGLFSGAASGLGNRYTGGRFGGYGGGGYGGYGGGGYGGYGGGGYGGYGGGGYGGAYGGYGGYGGASGDYGQFMKRQNLSMQGSSKKDKQLPASFASPGQGDMTGSYMGYGGGYGGYGGRGYGGMPRVIPNPLDNTLLMQCTPQEYKQILNLLEKIDTPPRQVLIDAKIYEVSLTGAFAAGVSAYLQTKGASGGKALPSLKPLGNITSTGINLSVGALVDQSRELLLFLQAKENNTRAKVISAPTLIATDSIPATMNVGTEVPTLTGQSVSPVQTGGSSQMFNNIQNRESGVTLGILATVNDSGIVTMVIDQEVSTPIPPAAGSIQSPSFSKRTIQTQVTVQDGDTIAIGGIINETHTISSGGFPGLHRIPIIGYAFGAKSRSTERTELVVFLTPRVIYDTNQVTEATEELKSRFRRLSKLMKEEQ